MVGERGSRLTVVLVVIIAILALVLIYAFVVRPSINGYVSKIQTQEDVRVLNAILSQLQQTGGVMQIPIGNQTITLYAQNILPQVCGQFAAANTTK